jgi:hypothetical protein
VYTINAFDDAANKASESVTITLGAKLYSPARGAFVRSPSLLAWRPYAGATYYNLQRQRPEADVRDLRRRVVELERRRGTAGLVACIVAAGAVDRRVRRIRTAVRRLGT